ncbi:MAG: hypothetical protein ACFNS8_00860 [Kingella oralis]
MQTMRQPETFVKPTTDGASAARCHVGKPICKPSGSEMPPFHFGFQAASMAINPYIRQALRQSGCRPPCL